MGLTTHKSQQLQNFQMNLIIVKVRVSPPLFSILTTLTALTGKQIIIPSPSHNFGPGVQPPPRPPPLWSSFFHFHAAAFYKTLPKHRLAQTLWSRHLLKILDLPLTGVRCSQGNRKQWQFLHFYLHFTLAFFWKKNSPSVITPWNRK